jgi:hypothetical protein
MPTIRVSSSAGPYSVRCEPNALSRAASLIAGLGESTGIFFLSSPRVWSFWGKTLALKMPGGPRRRPILFDDREAAKNLATVEKVARQLVTAGADRHAILVAVGGGVVGDVAGFAAATYLRGVRLVHIPTTLVAQVDSAIGGKTGVNLPEGKNLVGAFYPPKLVIADPGVLRTLPHREYRSGLYEVVKYGVIADEKLFEFLERRMDAVLRRDPAALAWAHAGPRAGSCHKIPAVPPRRGDRLGHGRRNDDGSRSGTPRRFRRDSHHSLGRERWTAASARKYSRVGASSNSRWRQESARRTPALGSAAPNWENGMGR